jgi:signal transduction histidine kinase/CheY-like chemotaxis protein/HPt (histidine-containing phosphotransfer) domain-containing protein
MNMANKYFVYYILSAFIVAAIILTIVRYNASENLTSLQNGNDQLLRELVISNHLRTIDRDLLGVESRIRAAIATGDTSHLEGVDQKINEVNGFLDTLKLTSHDAKTMQYLDRLEVLASEKIRIKHQLMERFLRTGEMNDTSLIANPRARRISDEIMVATHQIYDSRQKTMQALSNRIGEGSRKARLFGNIYISLLLISCVGGCWFIISQFREQNNLITRLDVSEKTAREALQVKENFLANMSHEIRTPLNSILGFTNLLTKKQLDADSTEFVVSIQSAGENLLAIVNDILDLSKIDAGMMRIVVNPFSVRGLLHSIETLFGEKVKEKGLTLTSRIDPEIPDTLIGDATRLTQIMVNLIGNALKFSDQGVISIDVQAEKISQEMINLRFTVTDRGIGIGKEKLESIFERFSQAEDSITRNYGGTGLGLSIVKKLITMQNGEIQVASQAGKGTSFKFFIPYQIAPEQITAETDPDLNILKNSMNLSVKILVVDDNAMNQSLMKHLLTQWNTSFDIVSNGISAIENLKQNNYDLVLMDIQMPEMDGYTAAGIIRERLGLQIPIIAMTAHAMAGEREKSLSHGMKEYISKPINERDLFELIRKFVPGIGSPIPMEVGIEIENKHQFIDLHGMREISRGNVDYEKFVLGQFIDTVPGDLKSLQLALDRKDFFSLRSIAHNMKTSIGIVGLTPLLESDLDKLEESKADASDLQTCLDTIEKICGNAIKEAKVVYSTLTV